jgi:hypothetical protein
MVFWFMGQQTMDEVQKYASTNTTETYRNEKFLSHDLPEEMR